MLGAQAPTRSKASLENAPAHAGESLLGDRTSHPDWSEIPGGGVQASIGGSSLTLKPADGQDDAEAGILLSAWANGRRVWAIQSWFAGGSDAAFTWRPGANVLIAYQSRSGATIWNIATGERVSEAGFSGLVESSDGQWGILTPWFSWFTECLSGEAVMRITLTGPVQLKPVAVLSPGEQCPGLGERGGFITAAISPDGKLYAVVRTTFDYETGLKGDGVIDLFDASTDERIATLKTKLPPHFEFVRFSDSGAYLALGSVEEAKPVEYQWVRITR
jgi:hypothetical protein